MFSYFSYLFHDALKIHHFFISSSLICFVLFSFLTLISAGESDAVKKSSLSESVAQRDALKDEHPNRSAVDSHHAVRSPIVLSGKSIF